MPLLAHAAAARSGCARRPRCGRTFRRPEELGAYGEDADLRPELVKITLDRSGTTATDAILLGDTPADIESGRENGVRVIAVATGRSTVADLRKAGADHVDKDLSLTTELIMCST